MATGEDMIAATVESAMGNQYKFKHYIYKDIYLSTYVLHSSKNGYFDGIIYKNCIRIIKVLYKKKYDAVSIFRWR